MNQTPPSLKSARVLVLALIAGLVFFTVVAGALVLMGRQQTRPELLNMLLAGTSVVLVSGVMMSLALPAYFTSMTRRQAQGKPAEQAAETVLRGFVTIAVARGALIEAPGLLGGVGLLLTGNFLFAVVPLVCAGLLLGSLPNQQRFRAFTQRVFEVR